MTDRPKVLVIAGYFDWFSGYQEIGLTRALSTFADVHVLASNRVSPIFSDSHLADIGQDRNYPCGTTHEMGAMVHRVPAWEVRSMVWNHKAKSLVEQGDYDHIVQVMPGQLFPMAATVAKTTARRSILFGDNSAMYANLSPTLARLKYLVFSLTKGTLYKTATARADRVYAYTPETITRLDRFRSGRSIELLPLTFDESKFFPSPSIRNEARNQMGVDPSDYLLIAPGKVQPQKRFEELVEVFEIISDEFTNARLIFAGVSDDPASQQLIRKIERSRAREFILVHGFLSHTELNELFNACDLGVWPKMPAITIQQAMGTGLRVIIPDNGLVGHLVRTPFAGVKIPEQSPLHDSLLKCLRGELTAARCTTHDERFQRSAKNSWLSTKTAAHRIIDEIGTTEI